MMAAVAVWILLLPTLLLLVVALTAATPQLFVFCVAARVVDNNDVGGGGGVDGDRTSGERNSEASNNVDGSRQQLQPPKQQQQQECALNPMGGQQCIAATDDNDDDDSEGSTADDTTTTTIRSDGGINVRTTSQSSSTSTSTTTTRPDDTIWTVGTVDEIHEYLNCSKMNDGYSFIHTNESWTVLNNLYNNLMATKNKPSSVPPTFVASGFQYPIEIRYDPARGRGIFLKDDEEDSSSSSSKIIRKGSLVWKGVNTASFDDPQDFRDFVQSLTAFAPSSSASTSTSTSVHPNANPSNGKNNNNSRNQHQHQHYHQHQLACDVLIWAYTRLVSDEEDDEYLACVDLDEGSMVNSASWSGNTTLNNNNNNNKNVGGTNATSATRTLNGGQDKNYTNPANYAATAADDGDESTNDAANCALGFDDGPMPENPTEQDYERIWYGCYMYFYATKDIYPGTEIIADYNEFSEHAFDEMGL